MHVYTRENGGTEPKSRVCQISLTKGTNPHQNKEHTYAEFASAIRDGTSPEVDAYQGTRSIALAFAILESGRAGRPVTVDEVMTERVDAYQREINES